MDVISTIPDKNKIRSVKSGLWLMRLAYAAIALSALMDLISSFSEVSNLGTYLSIGVRIISAGIIIFAVTLARRGKTKRATLITIITSIVAFVATGIFSPINLGWLLGIVISLLLSLIAIQLMPQTWMGVGILISFLGGVVVALTDYFNKSVIYQIDFRDPQYILMLALTAVLTYFIFSRFSTYPVTAKLVLAIASLSVVIFNILGIITANFIQDQSGMSPATILSINSIYLLGSQISIGFSAIIALLLARFIIRPLFDIVEVAEKISNDGDLSKQSRVFYSDEIGYMATSFNHLIDTLNTVAKNAATISKGDLTVHFNARSEKDVLGNAFVLMTEKLRNLVGQISSNSEKVTLASTDLADAANFAGSAAAQISHTMDQIAAGAVQQADVASKSAGAVEELQIAINSVEQGILMQSKAVTQAMELTDNIVNAIQKVIVDAQAGVSKAGEAMSEADGGARTIQQTILGMGTVQAKVETSSQKVREMKKRSDEIGSILEVIEEITSQINLLSLNAAIEAARAGEAGKGFAVVADEVRKLADKSTTATKEIGKLIQSINITTDEAVSSMNGSLDEVKSGTTQAASAGQALSKIINTVKGMQNQVKQIADSAALVDEYTAGLIRSMGQVNSIVESNTSATQEMTLHSKDVAKSVENIASISEENSASVEEVSSNVIEMSSQVTKVNHSAQMLTEMANDLQEQVQQFVF